MTTDTDAASAPSTGSGADERVVSLSNHSASRLRYLLTRIVGMYLPFWNETYKRHQCSFCHSRITRYADLQRPEYHGEGCIWIQARAFLKKLATAPAEDTTP